MKLNIRGKSGKSYIFHTYTLPAKLTAVGGVYMYLKLQKNGDFKIIKIGNTHNFIDVMVNHSQIKKLGATHITAIQKNNKAKREQIANDIRYLLKR
jgi:hypothetical protein